MPTTHEAKKIAEEYDRKLIVSTLEETGGNISAAARLLRLSRRTLDAQVRRLGLRGWLRQNYWQPGCPKPVGPPLPEK